MEQRGVGEHAIELLIRQIEFEKILLPHFAAGMDPCHLGEARSAFQTDRDVALPGKLPEVAPRPTAEIEYRERRLPLDGLQERRDILIDIMITRALPEIIGTLIVIFQRETGDILQFLWIKFHVEYSTLLRIHTAPKRHGGEGLECVHQVLHVYPRQ